MHFARVLRSAGIAVGTDRVQLALQALRIAGFDSRADFHAVLSTCLLDRIEHKDLFDQAFELFWRDPDLEGRMRAMLLPKVRAQAGADPGAAREPAPGRCAVPEPTARRAAARARRIDAVRRRVHGQRAEVLRKADFDTMSADEWRAARRALSHDALGVRAAADAARRARRRAPAASTGAPRCRRWRATAASWARCAGAGRARCRRRWWCWPTSRAR